MTTSVSTVPFFKHDLGQAELDSISDVFKTPILTTGDFVTTFERRFEELVDLKHALGVTSCTGAMHMSLVALGIGPGDEVITTPLTFIATSTAILEAGATPVFVDVEPDTGNLDASKIEAAITPRTRAIIPVHLYGQMCDMQAIAKIAKKHGLHVIEDAAHCVEGERDGIRPGQASATACYSFYATKNLTCGEGGAVATNDSDLARELKLLRTHGMDKTANDRSKEGYKHWDMVRLGWKYNMDNIHAAILLPQIDRFDENWKKRAALAEYYFERLSQIPGVKFPVAKPGVRHAHHLFTIWIEPPHSRDKVIHALQQRGIGVMVNYRAIHLLTYFQELLNHQPGHLPNAESIGDKTISIPFYPSMPLEHVDIVARALKEALC